MDTPLLCTMPPTSITQLIRTRKQFFWDIGRTQRPRVWPRCFLGAWHALLGLVMNLRNDVFNPFTPLTHTSSLLRPNCPCFLTRSAAVLHPLTLHVGDVAMWNGPHQTRCGKGGFLGWGRPHHVGCARHHPAHRPASCG